MEQQEKKRYIIPLNSPLNLNSPDRPVAIQKPSLILNETNMVDDHTLNYFKFEYDGWYDGYRSVVRPMTALEPAARMGPNNPNEPGYDESQNEAVKGVDIHHQNCWELKTLTNPVHRITIGSGELVTLPPALIPGDPNYDKDDPVELVGTGEYGYVSSSRSYVSNVNGFTIPAGHYRFAEMLYDSDNNPTGERRHWLIGVTKYAGEQGYLFNVRYDSETYQVQEFYTHNTTWYEGDIQDGTCPYNVAIVPERGIYALDISRRLILNTYGTPRYAIDIKLPLVTANPYPSLYVGDVEATQSQTQLKLYSGDTHVLTYDANPSDGTSIPYLYCELNTFAIADAGSGIHNWGVKYIPQQIATVTFNTQKHIMRLLGVRDVTDKRVLEAFGFSSEGGVLTDGPTGYAAVDKWAPSQSISSVSQSNATVAPAFKYEIQRGGQVTDAAKTALALRLHFDRVWIRNAFGSFYIHSADIWPHWHDGIQMDDGNLRLYFDTPTIEAKILYNPTGNIIKSEVIDWNTMQDITPQYIADANMSLGDMFEVYTPTYTGGADTDETLANESHVYEEDFVNGERIEPAPHASGDSAPSTLAFTAYTYHNGGISAGFGQASHWHTHVSRWGQNFGYNVANVHIMNMSRAYHKWGNSKKFHAYCRFLFEYCCDFDSLLDDENNTSQLGLVDLQNRGSLYKYIRLDYNKYMDPLYGFFDAVGMQISLWLQARAYIEGEEEWSGSDRFIAYHWDNIKVLAANRWPIAMNRASVSHESNDMQRSRQYWRYKGKVTTEGTVTSDGDNIPEEQTRTVRNSDYGVQGAPAFYKGASNPKSWFYSPRVYKSDANATAYLEGTYSSVFRINQWFGAQPQDYDNDYNAVCYNYQDASGSSIIGAQQANGWVTLAGDGFNISALRSLKGRGSPATVGELQIVGLNGIIVGLLMPPDPAPDTTSPYPYQKTNFPITLDNLNFWTLRGKALQAQDWVVKTIDPSGAASGITSTAVEAVIDNPVDGNITLTVSLQGPGLEKGPVYQTIPSDSADGDPIEVSAAPAGSQKLDLQFVILYDMQPVISNAKVIFDNGIDTTAIADKATSDYNTRNQRIYISDPDLVWYTGYTGSTVYNRWVNNREIQEVKFDIVDNGDPELRSIATGGDRRTVNIWTRIGDLQNGSSNTDYNVIKVISTADSKSINVDTCDYLVLAHQKVNQTRVYIKDDIIRHFKGQGLSVYSSLGVNATAHCSLLNDAPSYSPLIQTIVTYDITDPEGTVVTDQMLETRHYYNDTISELQEYIDADHVKNYWYPQSYKSATPSTVTEIALAENERFYARFYPWAIEGCDYYPSHTVSCIIDPETAADPMIQIQINHNPPTLAPDNEYITIPRDSVGSYRIETEDIFNRTTNIEYIDRQRVQDTIVIKSRTVGRSASYSGVDGPEIETE